MALNILVGYTGLRLFRPRRLVRPGGLCGRHCLQRKLLPGSILLSDLAGVAVVAVDRAAFRLTHPAPARRVFLAADAGPGGDALYDRLPLDRGNRRRKRSRRHHAADVARLRPRYLAGLSMCWSPRSALPSSYLLWRFHRSPVGRSWWRSARTRQRARFIGYQANRYKLAGFRGLGGDHRPRRHRSCSSTTAWPRPIRSRSPSRVNCWPWW